MELSRSRVRRKFHARFWRRGRSGNAPIDSNYVNLTPDERWAFDGILSYLTFLDSVQTCNIPHLKSCVTAPEISLCMAEQTSQEAMHNQS
jgi:ribonucleoside-diphosphate reductase beta chain